MGFLSELVNKYREKRSAEYISAMEVMSKWSDRMESTLSLKGQIKRSDYSEFINDLYQDAGDTEKLNKRLVIISNKTVEAFKSAYISFQKKVNTFESDIENHNTSYLKALISEARQSIGTIEGHDLDDQQMMCILKKAHSHNVVAGAGTGKTTTIIGKVKYLLNHEKIAPKDILVLSFTHAAASEMKERLKANTSVDIAVSTFHRFGYYILSQVEGKKPLIFSKSPRAIFKNTLDNLLNNQRYERAFLRYMGNSGGADRSDLDAEFESVEDYQTYMREHKPITLKGEEVKSYGELHVANCLAINGINYEYETAYEHATATKEYAQYMPDFYLPDFHIYIEFFGIDRDGRVPEWFEGDNPTLTYQEGIAWKRKIHEEYGTKLIECYSYEDFEGILEDELLKKLASAGVSGKEVSVYDLLNSSGESASNKINSFLSSVESIISLARNKKMNAEDLLTYEFSNKTTHAIAQLVSPIQKQYENYLQSTNQIDFADMLIKAEQYIKDGKYVNTFKYVIVDEYQDATASQFRLLKALRKSCDFDLFCVGDDWQSIYRFNGSDVSYIMDFEEFWGPSEISRIETTYRFSQSLIDISSYFVMKNPRQIKKSIRSGNKDTPNSFAVSKIEGYREENTIQFMVDRLLYLPQKSSVYLIGRYTFDIDMLKTDKRLSVKFDTATQTQKVNLQGRADLDITFYTAHRSKGLQADYVFVLNNRNDMLGFPSRVEDNLLTNALLEKSDHYPYSEERRLFYVSLTRAKKHVYLLTVKDRESVFVKELEEEYPNQLKNETYICPICGGKLRVIDGQYGKFLGCENYKTQNCRFSSKL